MVRRGPTLTSHFPAKAADSPRKKIASENIQPSVVSAQSSGADCVMPITLVKGALNTENAYAWPMNKSTASAAGGTIQRLNPGAAIEASFEKKDGSAPTGMPMTAAEVMSDMDD